MKKIYMLIMIFSIFMSSCQNSEYLPCGEDVMPEIGEIKIKDIIYVEYYSSRIRIQADDLTNEIAEVKHKVPKYGECIEATLTSESQDGDATHLPKGTKIYQHKQYHPTFRVVAKVNENSYRLYEIIRNPSAKTFGERYKLENLIRSVYLNSFELTQEDAQRITEEYLNHPIVKSENVTHPELDETTSLRFKLIDGTTTLIHFYPKSKTFGSSIIMNDEFYDAYQEIWNKLIEQLEKEREAKESAD